MIARSLASRIGGSALKSSHAAPWHPRFLAVGAAAQSYVVFDEATGPLSGVVEKPNAKVIAYFTAA